MKTTSRRPAKRSLRKNLDVHLARLEDVQMVRRDLDEDLSYSFKHSLTQETAYESLLHQERREIHRRVAQAFERFYSSHLDDYAAQLAQHYAQAGDGAKTLEYSIRAGDVAMRVYANDESVTQYTRALQVAKDRAGSMENIVPLRELYLKLGRALELLSHFDEAARNYDEMLALSRARGDRNLELAALIACATIRSIPGSARDEQQGRRFADQALTLARALGDRSAEAKILWILMLLDIYTGGDVPQGVRRGEESLAIARELGLREQTAFALQDLFVAYAMLGDFDRARAVRLEAGGIWRELDNKPMLAECISGLALTHYMQGEFAKAVSMAEEAFQISTSIGNIGGQGFSGYTLGLSHYERGEITQAIKSIEDAIPITEFGGLEGNGISPKGMLAVIYAELGDLDRALDFIRRALEGSSARLPFHKMWLNAVLTHIELLAGNARAAEEAFREGQIVASVENFNSLFPPGAPFLYFAAVEYTLAHHQNDRAVETLDSMSEHLVRPRGIRVAVPDLLYLKAQALDRLGRSGQALKALNEARSEAEAIGSRRILWRILAAIAETEGAHGNQIGADAAREEARHVIEYIAEHTPPDLRDRLLNSPAVRPVFRAEMTR